ncbi:hypothetical protein BGZ95_007305 [Linnemannia exigua]|uniref:Uncharacterized protein n=1 Tax=Linnemannia exigua TaxID=604196 RepID=A0AAD4DHE8_9FUNG|nr:hypothetical protein BGZ95_007305 [Linnemannia exigua]
MHSPPTPPLEEIRKSIEMIQSLPVIMSPTIPSWPAPLRSTTGGKQPGKVPTVSLNLGASSDDSSGSGDDSDSGSSDVGSENAAMSEVDMSRSRKQIGRKTARRRNSKTESIGGKRPAGSSAGKTIPDSIRQPGMDSRARKTSAAQYCSLLTSAQVAELPRRQAGMVLSSAPVVVKINIPAHLLPALTASTQAAERTRASHASKSLSRGGYRRDSSDDDHAMDIDAPSGASQETSRPTLKDVQGRSSRLQDAPSSPHRPKTLSKRGRSYSSDESVSDDRKKPKGSTKELKEKSSFDILHSDKKRSSDKLATLNTDTKRGLSSTTSSRVRSDTAEEKNYRTDRGDEKRSTEATTRGKSSQSLSPVLERNKDKNRRLPYHSADEGASDDSRKDKRRSKDGKQNNDHTETSRSRLESKDKDTNSRSETANQSRKRDTSRDRPSETPDVRRNTKEENARESKEKTIALEKPSFTNASKDRRTSKDEDVPVSSRTGPKSEPKTERTGSAAAPGSPGRRSARDQPKETKLRGEKDTRDNTASSVQRSTIGAKDRTRGRSRTPSRTRSRSRSPRRYDRNRSPTRNDTRDGKSNRDRREYDDDRSSRRKRDGSRDRNDRSGRGRSRDRFGRDRSRDKSTDRNRDRSPARGTSRERSRDRKRARSRSRDRGDGRKETDRRARETSATPSGSNTATSRADTRTDTRTDARPDSKSQPPSQDSAKGGLSRRDSESKHGASTAILNPPRPPPPTIKEEPLVQPPPPTTAPPDSIPRSSGVTGVVKETIVKRVSIEDYQRKKTTLAATDKVDTPKAASDSPALANAVVSTGKPPIVAKESSQKLATMDQKPPSSTSSKPSSETAKKIADYHNTFNVRRAAGITYKHNADSTLKNQSNAKLGAIQYFLSAIEFIAAFHANDKYHSLLNPGRPDVAVKASINSWDTMRQFIHALSNQCHSNRLTGLDGVSALMEVLVYYKVYSYQTMNLRKDMLKSGQFKPKVPVKEEGGAAPTVAISPDMASRMLQNVEDWAHIQKRMDDCRQWLTPDIAQKQFPQTFEKWCIHPDRIGGQGQPPMDGFVAGTSIPRIHWPLGMHLHLHELMAFVESALEEYQKRNGLEHTR